MAIDKTKLDELIEKMKTEAKELGLDIEENEAKDKWAETATTDPDTARRQLRAFWAIVGTVAGFILGLGVGYVIWGLF